MIILLQTLHQTIVKILAISNTTLVQRHFHKSNILELLHIVYCLKLRLFFGNGKSGIWIWRNKVRYGHMKAKDVKQNSNIHIHFNRKRCRLKNLCKKILNLLISRTILGLRLVELLSKKGLHLKFTSKMILSVI